MTKPKSAKPPYLTSAFFCEKVLYEQDGVISAIRVIDRITATPTKKPPKKLPPIPVNASLVVGLKSGEFQGDGKIRVEAIKPSGVPLSPEVVETSVTLLGGDAGASVVFQVQISVTEQGTYWFDIFFNKRWLTRIPLSVHALEPEKAKRNSKKKSKSSS